MLIRNLFICPCRLYICTRLRLLMARNQQNRTSNAIFNLPCWYPCFVSCRHFRLRVCTHSNWELDRWREVAVSLTGQRIFATNCAACHGLDARGGEHAPDIATRREAQQSSDETLLHIVQNGVAGTGMPAFSTLGISEVQGLIRYLRTLQGQTLPVKLPGDPEVGKGLFYGKAGCSACHMANGKEGSSVLIYQVIPARGRWTIFALLLQIQTGILTLESDPLS